MIQTSLDAFIAERPKIGEKQKEVYYAIRALGEATDKGLARYLHFDINTITPRRGELRQMGYIMSSGERACKITGRRATTWKVCKTLF